MERLLSGIVGQRDARPLLAGMRLIGLPIPDIQHENPRGVGKGRLLIPSGRLALPTAVAAGSGSGLSRSYVA
jgi:hypothetical protein